MLHQQATGRPALKRGTLEIISPAALRELLETLGPTFVKLGQVLSLRPDLVGEELSREFSRLQSAVAPFPFSRVERIIAEEFGKGIDRLFALFEPDPVAAASLAQVHRAYLSDGAEVAVKVQRPDIGPTIEQDVYLLQHLVRLAERFIPEVRPYNPVRVVQEFADWTRRELDFRSEAHNAERFRFIFRDNPHIKIPAVHWGHTSRRVLTMEYVHGVRADDLPGIERSGLDRRELALHGVDAQLQQILIDGFFHADPHPGNSIALAGNVLCFYDFGMVGHLDENQRRELISCLLAFAGRDIDTFLRHFLHVAEVNPGSDVAGFHRDASELLGEIFFSPRNANVAWLFFRLIHRGAARNIAFPPDFALFSKALITTEAMGLTLYPDFDLSEHLAPFAKKAFDAYIDPMQLRHSFATDMIDYVAFMKELPERVRGLLKKLAQEERAPTRLDARDLDTLQSAVQRQSDRRLAQVALLCLAALLAAFAVLGGSLPAPVSSILNIGMLFFFVLFLLFLFRSRKGRQ
jgi:ubiquinone biosynthesis protein